MKMRQTLKFNIAVVLIVRYNIQVKSNNNKLIIIHQFILYPHSPQYHLSLKPDSDSINYCHNYRIRWYLEMRLITMQSKASFLPIIYSIYHPSSMTLFLYPSN